MPANLDAKRGWFEQLGRLDAEQRVQEMALERAHEMAVDKRKENVAEALAECHAKRANIASLAHQEPFQPATT